MDPEQFGQLALPLFDSLYNLARWLTGERADAEDLVQETYAKALKGFDRFQAGTNFRAWMFRILRNTFLTSRAGLAAKMTVPLEEETEELWSETTPESAALIEADRERVGRALASLDVQQREVLLLCDFEEMSYREMAEILGVPIGTVMSRVARARRALRIALTEKKRASHE